MLLSRHPSSFLAGKLNQISTLLAKNFLDVNFHNGVSLKG